MNHKRLLVLAVLIILFALVALVLPASAQGDEPPAPDGDIDLLPGWLMGLMIGATSIGAIITSVTELLKTILKMIGLYRDGLGRYIALALAVALVGVLLATESFGLHDTIDPAAAQLLAISEAFLGLLAAVGAYDYSKTRGLLPIARADPRSW